MNKFRLAMVQHAPESIEPEVNTAIAEDFIREAAENSADLVLFPECFLTSYKFPDICEHLLPVEKIENDPEFLDWQKRSVDENDIYLKRIQNICRELSIGAEITAFSKGEKYPQNSAYIIGKDGSILLKYSKVHTCDFDVERYLEGGDGFSVCDFEGTKLGTMICYDREYPESARELMLAGAEMILVPNDCEGMAPRLRELAVRAMENRCSVAMANPPSKHGGSSCAYTPMVWNWDQNDEFIDTELVCAAPEFDGLVYADFDMEEIRNYRAREDIGKFRKPIAYKHLKSTD